MKPVVRTLRTLLPETINQFKGRDSLPIPLHVSSTASQELHEQLKGLRTVRTQGLPIPIMIKQRSRFRKTPAYDTVF